MWDESFNVYPMLGAEEKLGNLGWQFPSGAKITFAGIQYESDKKKYHGAQIPLICFDQLEEFTESMFFYMLSRNRSTSGVKGYIRATANPEPNWLAEFIGWWIGEDGFAIAERAGVVRWFVRPGDRIEWADSPEELAHFTIDGEPIQPKSVTFIPASVYDNKILLEKDPSYLASLQALPPVERARLLGDREKGGNWKIKPEAGLLYNRNWYELVSVLPDRGNECLFWDLAATKSDFKDSKNPSYTAGVCIRKIGQTYFVHHVYANQIGPAEVERQFVNLTKQLAAQARAVGTSFMVRWEEEPGSASKRESRRLVGLLDGLDAKGIRSTKDKISDGRAFSSQSEAGNVKVMNKKWAEGWLDHMHNQPDNPFDDIHDATVKGYNQIANRFTGSISVGKAKVVQGAN